MTSSSFSSLALRPLARALALAASLAALGGCGDDDGAGPSSAQISRACNASCGKIDECYSGTPGLPSRSQCVSSCMQSATSDSTCNPSSAEIDRCISAVETISCEALMEDDALSECEFCEASGGGGDAGTTPLDASGGLDAAAGATCDELESCCPMLPEGDARSSCESLVEMNDDGACSQALMAFRLGGLCGA